MSTFGRTCSRTSRLLEIEEEAEGKGKRVATSRRAGDGSLGIGSLRS